MTRLAKVPTIQLAKIDRALKADADAHRLITGTLMEFDGVRPRTRTECKSAGRCALGSLMFYAPSISVWSIVSAFPRPKQVAQLQRIYGLLELHLDAIYETNDNTEDADNNGTRYEEVMALVTFAEWAQQEGIRFRSGYALREAYALGKFDDYNG